MEKEKWIEFIEVFIDLIGAGELGSLPIKMDGDEIIFHFQSLFTELGHRRKLLSLPYQKEIYRKDLLKKEKLFKTEFRRIKRKRYRAFLINLKCLYETLYSEKFSSYEEFHNFLILGLLTSPLAGQSKKRKLNKILWGMYSTNLELRKYKESYDPKRNFLKAIFNSFAGKGQRIKTPFIRVKVRTNNIPCLVFNLPAVYHDLCPEEKEKRYKGYIKLKILKECFEMAVRDGQEVKKYISKKHPPRVTTMYFFRKKKNRFPANGFKQSFEIDLWDLLNYPEIHWLKWKIQSLQDMYEFLKKALDRRDINLRHDEKHGRLPKGIHAPPTKKRKRAINRKKRKLKRTFMGDTFLKEKDFFIILFYKILFKEIKTPYIKLEKEQLIFNFRAVYEENAENLKFNQNFYREQFRLLKEMKKVILSLDSIRHYSNKRKQMSVVLDLQKYWDIYLPDNIKNFFTNDFEIFRASIRDALRHCQERREAENKVESGK